MTRRMLLSVAFPIAVVLLTVVAGTLGACGASAHEEESSTQDKTTATESTTRWVPLAQASPALAVALENPEDAVEDGASITYVYEGETGLTLELDDSEATGVLTALAAIEVGTASDTRWDDYGDTFVIRLTDGQTHRVSLEGHAVLVDESDHMQAFEVRGAEALWRITHAIIERADESE